MNAELAHEKVIQIIAPFARNTAALATATSTTRIIEDLGVNSARLVDIILTFEDQFDITVDDEAADRVRTLGDAVTMVCEKLSA